ncbi:MAG: DUF4132 domain-containing protein [Erysipelotrichaceae bacterium]|nr:DUF4132 domain-containing protein [Erysipelotrichaceae bacterium]
MAYGYESRRTFSDKLFNDWTSTNALKIKRLDVEVWRVYEEIIAGTHKEFVSRVQITKYYEKHHKKETLAEFVKKYLKPLVDLFVPKECTDDFYHVVDSMTEYPYPIGWNRRSLRSKDPAVHLGHLEQLLYAYMVFGTYQVSVNDYVRENLEEELLDFKKNTEENRNFKMCLSMQDDMFAARIDANDTQFIETVKEAFLSDRNTVVVSRELIRGVVKSHNTELHDLLGKFLLAARLSEGVRQVICENADCGTKEAFVRLCKVIAENNLLRFAAVKRAVGTWTALYNSDQAERLTEKVFGMVLHVAEDPEYAESLLNSTDCVEIYLGLWGLAYEDVNLAVQKMKELAQNGTRLQALTIGYFNEIIQIPEVTRDVAVLMFETYPDDLELMAVYMNTYLPNSKVFELLRLLADRGEQSLLVAREEDFTYIKPEITMLMPDKKTAEKQYEILKQAQSTAKKEQVFSPVVFPWYGVKLTRSQLVVPMMFLAYVLEDPDKMDEVCGMLPLVDADTGHRQNLLRLLLHEPKTEVQRTTLLEAIADREGQTRSTAFRILSAKQLKKEDIRKLEGHLKGKNQEVRTNTLQLLMKQTEEGQTESAKRLLSDSNVQVRLAGYDILKKLSEAHPEKKETYGSLLISCVGNADALSEQEKILFEEIVKEHTTEDILNVKGYGLYPENFTLDIPKEYTNVPRDGKNVRNRFDMSGKDFEKIETAFDQLIQKEGTREYTDFYGDTQLLGNEFRQIAGADKPYHLRYPFPELWEQFYDEHIRDEKAFWNVYVAVTFNNVEEEITDVAAYQKELTKLFGDAATYEYTSKNHKQFSYDSTLKTVLNCIASMKNFGFPRNLALEIAAYVADLPENMRWFTPRKRNYWYNEKDRVPFTKTRKLDIVWNTLGQWRNEEEFAENFWAKVQVDRAFDFRNNSFRNGIQRDDLVNYVSLYPCLKMAEYKRIPMEAVSWYGLEVLGAKETMNELKNFSGITLTRYMYGCLKGYMKADWDTKELDTECEYYKQGKALYERIAGIMLDVELKRGDSQTPFSTAIGQLQTIKGMNRLFEVLNALGKDTLDRNAYYVYSWSVPTGSRKECLSHILKMSEPAEGDSFEEFAKLCKKYKIKEERLMEVAMYNPKWIDWIERYVQCDGLKSCCYYFMAHMNERFDDRKMAIIAKYTPLSQEELNEGCFDTEWFTQAYETIGEQRFMKLYNAAKYISDGTKHTRARKYADACLGKVELADLEKQIADKRNKDLIMSYGLVPATGKEDQLHRYEFLQKFLKESKQFGAQRRASEAKCVEVALKNMATSLGYEDDLRLTLAMETALVNDNGNYFVPQTAGDYAMYISVSSDGKSSLVVEKAGKKLNSVPAALKKDETYLEIKEFAEKLKDQYSRSVKMFENAMEERTAYGLKELAVLQTNPVIGAILDKLVFVYEDTLCLFSDLSNKEGTVRIAHPVDFYQKKVWTDWQQYWFDRQMKTDEKQPFKQIFRELYVRLEEENEQMSSRMFAGNQIQPKKTVATLKTRRWIADYENGLQKVYYKDNIIATIYAMADWFSPADGEDPTLEYVAFYDRKTFELKRIKDIPDIVYSEVMRDVDLAVSVAHAGGVDPLTSHSTMEMRKVIVDFNTKLFKLDNVKTEGTHAIVTGTYGTYSVHLGSGVVHKMGSSMILMVPVHSQNRGKVFLPFVDEDPKTAEIVSKILMLAEDDKIKDPEILAKIRK